MSVQNILSIILWSWYSGVQLQLSEGERARKDVVTTTAGGLTKWRGRGYGWVDYGWWGVSHPLAEELVLCEGESGRQKHHVGPQVRSVHLQKKKKEEKTHFNSLFKTNKCIYHFSLDGEGDGGTLYTVLQLLFLLFTSSSVAYDLSSSSTIKSPNLLFLHIYTHWKKRASMEPWVKLSVTSACY